jgi:hypothetical protein
MGKVNLLFFNRLVYILRISYSVFVYFLQLFFFYFSRSILLQLLSFFFLRNLNKHLIICHILKVLQFIEIIFVVLPRNHFFVRRFRKLRNLLHLFMQKILGLLSFLNQGFDFIIVDKL